MYDPEFLKLYEEFSSYFDNDGHLKGFPPLESEPEPSLAPTPAPVSSPPPQRQTPNFNFGPHTQSVNGTPIDFDRLTKISKVDSFYNGTTTYGIRFDFKGSKGLYRTVWFNRNQQLRDDTFASNYSFWDTLNMLKGD